jgi:hypothetical protein
MIIQKDKKITVLGINKNLYWLRILKMLLRLPFPTHLQIPLHGKVANRYCTSHF